MVPTEHGRPAAGALLELVWTARRAEAFDERCHGD
jgi:hypothetical protein